MTPPKDRMKYKYRPATVVYQRMTPELMLAYRIFSPGLADQVGLDKLNSQMQRIAEDIYIAEEDFVDEDGKHGRRGVGILEDLKRQMDVTEAQITEAYNAYKAEIERMMEEDSAHLAAKALAAMAGEGGVGWGEKRGTKRKSSGSSTSGRDSNYGSSPSSASVADGRVQSETPSSPSEASDSTKSRSPSEDNDLRADLDGDDVDENGEYQNKLHSVPADRWMTHGEATSKLADAQLRVAAMRRALDDHHAFYTTQMVPRYEIDSAFTSAQSYLARVRGYVQDVAEAVEGHDGEVRQRNETNIWGDDRTAVTRLVLKLIPMVDEIPLRVVALEGILDEVAGFREKLAKAAVGETRKKFRAKLVEFAKQAHTPVPPPYWEKDVQKALKDLKEESSDRRRNKRAKTSNHEVITIEDD